jgi:hypothetical protein
MHSCEDRAKFYSAFLTTRLSYATGFQQKWGVKENLEYLGKFED